VRFLWLLVSLALGCASPAWSQAREGFITADDGTKLFYKIEGSGPQSLIVVHGGPGFSLESVRADFGRLARGRTVIYYDQRGNGRSDLVDDDSRLALKHHIADLDAVRRHFGLEKLTLLGNSWGGLLISAYAAAHPERIERLILDASAAPDIAQLNETTDEMDKRVEERLSPSEFRRLVDVADPKSWLTAKDPVAACRTLAVAIFRAYAFDWRRLPSSRGSLCEGPTDVLRRRLVVNQTIVQSLGAYDLRPAVRDVTAPALVMHGVADVIPVRAAKDWAESFPNGRLLLMQRSGHLMHLEQPDIFFEAIEKFLTGDWPSEAK
jgi:proline iminopeptidase